VLRDAGCSADEIAAALGTDGPDARVREG
jgi:hypothetical protein